MVKIETTYSILITTKNRKTDLAFTLEKIKVIFQKNTVECLVFDDGSINILNDSL